MEHTAGVPTRVSAPRIASGFDLHGPGWFEMADGYITGLGSGTAPTGSGPPGRHLILPDGVLVPGFVDLQCNGAFGIDFGAAAASQWRRALEKLPSTGVTSVVPTVISAPVEGLVAVLQRYRSLRPMLEAATGAARTLGVHLEGPFLSERRRGAHDAAVLCDPTSAAVAHLIAAGGDGALAYVTLAPERRGGLAAVGQFLQAGVHVSVGHSDATDDIVTAAADAGATLITHLFNAQRPLHHRDAGVVGAALSDARYTVGLIVDGHHVGPTALRVAFAAATGRIAIVTDAVSAMDMPAGRYELGGGVVDVAPDRPALRADGTLAGSAVGMDRAVSNAVRYGIPLSEAVAAATRIPADALGHHDRGRLQVGGRADVVWLSDDLRVRATWIEGRLAFSSPALPEPALHP